MQYHIITYGCQMNYSDSERIAAILKLAKIMPAKDITEADLLIINSCSVRQSAINRIYGQLINFKKNNKQNNKKKTILTGCLLESDKKKLKDKFDLIIDIKELINPKNNELKKLLKLINPEASEQEFKAFDYTDYFKINPQYRSNFSAYIPIMTGCNNFCSYCAVPYTRGREISRPAEEIIKEVKKLIKKGYKEITLLGQNVNSYRSEIQNTKLKILKHTSSFLRKQESSTAINSSEHAIANNKPNPTNWIPASAGMTKKIETMKQINFPKLLKQINNIPGDFWIRFLTSHPKDMSDELIKTMTQCDKVCEYIHLPIQSGDDKILKKMNRRYTAAHYLKLIKKIKLTYSRHSEPPTGGEESLANARGRAYARDSSSAHWRTQNDSVWQPPIAISTDIIVGFPGETKSQFSNTAKIMRNIKYDMAYLAQYSPRPGTAADKLKNNVPIIEKKRRKEFLNDILRQTALVNNKKYEKKIVEVLIEKNENGIATGKTRTFKNVRITTAPTSSCHPESASRRMKDPVATGKNILIPRDSSVARLPQNDILKPGKFALVKITQANAWGLEGEIAK